MEQDLIKSLPPEILSDILSRLDDVRTIASSKCVSKPWLDFLSTDEFVKLHLSRSAAALAVVSKKWQSGRLAVFELGDEFDAEGSHDHLTRFDFPHGVQIAGSANGLILLSDLDTLFICNPILREYIQVDFPRGCRKMARYGAVYGFGVSKISGQHKVFCIDDTCRIPVCIVYTLGTGSWRHVEPASLSITRHFISVAAFVNGNLHWLGLHSIKSLVFCCFDLETECFSTFPTPPVELRLGCPPECLFVLRGCLCVSERKPEEGDMALWLMKEYGDDKSWTKEYVVDLSPHFTHIDRIIKYPIQVFKEGDVLILLDYSDFYYCSNKTKSIRKICLCDRDGFMTSMLFTPSFLSLKSFPMENVISL